MENPITTSDDLSNWLRPGKSINIVYGPDNRNNHIEHIRAVIDDDYIVTRQWSLQQEALELSC